MIAAINAYCLCKRVFSGYNNGWFVASFSYPLATINVQLRRVAVSDGGGQVLDPLLILTRVSTEFTCTVVEQRLVCCCGIDAPRDLGVVVVQIEL